MQSEELELIRRAQSGDARAFDQLVILHDRRILGIISGILPGWQDVQDVYQETFVRAFEKIATFRFESEFSTWLGRIAINLSINRRKQGKLHNLFSLGKEGEENSTFIQLVDEKTPDSELMTQEFWCAFKSVLQQLPIQQKTVFILKHLQGYKIREIAVMLECAEGTVKNALFRATEKLRKNLDPLM